MTIEERISNLTLEKRQILIKANEEGRYVYSKLDGGKLLTEEENNRISEIMDQLGELEELRIKLRRRRISNEYDEKILNIIKAHKQVCPKCGGTGKLNCYSHIDNGNCFKCNGKGYL